MLAEQILSFFKKLKITAPLPKGVEVLNPYRNKETFSLCEKFYTRFYNDTHSRKVILGINPGRLGAGLTGVPFTDPTKLEMLGIPNAMPKVRELSSEFIYTFIDKFGGPEKFYKQFYFSSVSPLGFVSDGKNLNYYDQKELARALENFIVKSLKEQLSWGFDRNICFCLGEGENYKFIQKLNERHLFFERVVPLPHPRFIMQYKRKKVNEYIDKYLTELTD
ncbi:MAG TPA: DUF4918 domain-containing protein [Cytophagales bacterium]|nr:DUF4918 domain-containing protein [Cytophagales bacterium]